ncbi:hypothetical protein EV656_10825 [Rhodovulum adriaticum]|uniref:Uncharacterized protein n=3 Tax=Rhodovulum adriaticum TaxID=35804 RepID=A0A4R2NK76_RHOAD|nr:hypothetical protein EV656_10825 [Rhodovulum adriaticum]
MAPMARSHRPTKPDARPAPGRRVVWAGGMAAGMAGAAEMVAPEHLPDRAEARESET